MRKPILSTMFAVGLMLSATSALAGSYGEAEQPEELPTSPPAAQIVATETEIDYAAPGAYVGIGGLYSVEPSGGDSGGFDLQAGYRIIPNLAIEARYGQYFDAQEQDAFSVTANAKGYILTGRYQPYLLAGLGYLGNYSSGELGVGEGFMMRFGAGLDGYITEHISIGPEIAYVLDFGDGNDFDMFEISAGIKYHF